MAVVNVTDVPEIPGAGLLHFDDGKPPMIALPEVANDYRSHLGLNAMDNGVAGPGTGTPDPTALGSGAGVFATPKAETPDEFRQQYAAASAPAQQAHAAPPPSPLPPQFQTQPSNVRVASPQEWAGMQQGQPPAPGQQPGPGPQQGAVPPGIAAPDQQAAPQSLTDQALAASDARLANELITGRESGPSAPARPAGFSPDTKKIVTQSGPAYDVQAAGDRIDAGEAVLRAQMAQAQSQQEQANAAASRAAAQNLQAQQDVRDQKAEMQRKQQVYQAQDQHLQADLADYSESAKPDPRKYFSTPGGALSGMLSIIGQGLGAFGATLGHTQNWAFEAAQNQLRMEMAAQEKAYDAGRGDRKNALARLADYYHGDMDKARLALSQSLNKVAETETLAFGAQAKSKDVGSNAQVLAAQFRQQQLLDEQKRVELAQGTTTTEATDKYHQATSGGGPRLSDAREIAIRKALQPKDKDQGALGLSAQAVARQKANYSKKNEDLAAFADAIAHRATLMGVHFDPKTGEITNKQGKPAKASDLELPVGSGYIGKHISGDVLTPKAMELHRAEGNSVRLHAAQVYNHSISAEEADEEVDKTIGHTAESKFANTRYLADEYRRRKREIETGAASIDPRIVNERDAAQDAVNYARATGKPLPGPERRRGAQSGDAGPEPESESESDGGGG